MGYALDILMGKKKAPASVEPKQPSVPKHTVSVDPSMLHENRRIALLDKWTPVETDLTDMFKTKKGSMRLFPLQNQALHSCKAAGGGVLMMGCGKGKTLVSLLLAPHMGKSRPLLLIPAKLREKTKTEIKEVYAPNFNFPEPMVLSYEMLSRTSGLEKLREYQPDLVICDEAQAMKDISSARTARLGKYLVENDDCSLVVMSGTLFNKSVADFAHLAEWSLREKSPVPRNAYDVSVWDDLLKGEGNQFQHVAFMPMYDAWGRQHAKEAIYNRLKETCGVVLTKDDTPPCSLQITRRKLQVPDEVKTAIEDAFSGSMPMSDILMKAGVELLDDSIGASQHLWDNLDTLALHALSQMVTGMLYYWDWPSGVADEDWLQARRDWNAAVRAILECDLEDFDTPGLIFDGFEDLPMEVTRAFGDAYVNWSIQRDKDEPPRKQVWISEYMVDDVEAWLKKQREPSLIWVNNVALGEKLAARLGIPYYGGGVEFDMQNAHNCVLSIASHATGKNLQAWSNNLVVGSIASPEIWEQMIARTHRTGQQADTVTVTIYDHSIFGSSFKNATRMAKIVGDTTGQQQRIVIADIIKEKP